MAFVTDIDINVFAPDAQKDFLGYEKVFWAPDMSAPPRRCWVGNAASFCLCCRPTHSPSGSPIQTTSSIRWGAGTVGY